MSAVRPFVLRVEMSGEFFRLAPDKAREMARWQLIDAGHESLLGPRGGRYEPINEPFDFRDGESSDGWPNDVRTFTARVTGRYTRPTVPA